MTDFYLEYRQLFEDPIDHQYSRKLQNLDHMIFHKSVPSLQSHLNQNDKEIKNQHNTFKSKKFGDHLSSYQIQNQLLADYYKNNNSVDENFAKQKLYQRNFGNQKNRIFNNDEQYQIKQPRSQAQFQQNNYKKVKNFSSLDSRPYNIYTDPLDIPRLREIMLKNSEDDKFKNQIDQDYQYRPNYHSKSTKNIYNREKFNFNNDSMYSILQNSENDIRKSNFQKNNQNQEIENNKITSIQLEGFSKRKKFQDFYRNNIFSNESPKQTKRDNNPRFAHSVNAQNQINFNDSQPESSQTIQQGFENYQNRKILHKSTAEKEKEFSQNFQKSYWQRYEKGQQKAQECLQNREFNNIKGIKVERATRFKQIEEKTYIWR